MQPLSLSCPGFAAPELHQKHDVKGGPCLDFRPCLQMRFINSLELQFLSDYNKIRGEENEKLSCTADILHIKMIQ